MRLGWLSRSILRMRRNERGFIFLRRRFEFLVLGLGLVAVRAVWFFFGSLRWYPRFAFAFAGIRDSLSRFTRRRCAGRHLLFFAAAKKSRQKKAAHTANS